MMQRWIAAVFFLFAIAMLAGAQGRLLDGSDLQKACLNLPYMAKSYAIGTLLSLEEKMVANARQLAMEGAVALAFRQAYPCQKE